MPLVKAAQARYGKDKFQVLLLSVDKGWEMADAAKLDKECLAQHQVDWPNVLLPHGFDDTQTLFNVDGYGLTLIGPDGIVRGVDLRPEGVSELLAKIYTK